MEQPYANERTPAVRGYLHRAPHPWGAAVLAHGAGGNAQAPLLRRIAEALEENGVLVLRCDLPYRQRRASGPPRPHEAAEDREGLRRAVEAVREMTPGPVLLGGHSYGGRQASMLAAEDPTVADALLLLSYPLHPPHKSAQLRTAHFTALRLPALFVHGTRDPFGSIEEVRAAVPSQAELLIVQGAGHDLKPVDASEAARRAVAMLRSARRPSD
jgi:predicted alpha/beta-hydrolase family hydrolase